MSPTLTIPRVILLAAALATTATLVAQGKDLDHHHPKHHFYKLIDLGTFGGPASIIFGETGPLNEFGQVTSCADTPDLDPAFPNGNPYFGSMYLQHAFRWTAGVLEDLPPLDGGLASCGQWINDRGAVVGASEDGTLDASTGYRRVLATRWQHGSPLTLGTLGGDESVAWAVNDYGQIAGGAANTVPDSNAGGIFFPFGANQIHAFRWQKGYLRDLGTLGGTDSQGFYINNRGDVAGLSYINTVLNPVTGVPDVHPFLWKNDRMIDLGSLGGGFGFPTLVNDRSEVIGASDLAGDQASHPFLWRHGVLTDLGTLGGPDGQANWIDEAGEIVGTADLADLTHHAFVWKDGKIRDIGTVATDPCSNGFAINNLGQVVATSTDCQGNVLHLFLWDRGTIIDLTAHIRPAPAINFNEPVQINDRGEIAGTGIAPDGTTRAVLLVPDGDCDRDGKADAALSAQITHSVPATITIASTPRLTRPKSQFPRPQ